MTTKVRQSESELLPGRELCKIGTRPYAKPSLITRERLSRITAEDTKTSGIATDSAP